MLLAARRSATGLVAILPPAAVALARLQKLVKLFRAIEHASPDAKEANTSGFTGAKKGYAGDAQTLRCLLLRK